MSHIKFKAVLSMILCKTASVLSVQIMKYDCDKAAQSPITHLDDLTHLLCLNYFCSMNKKILFKLNNDMKYNNDF